MANDFDDALTELDELFRADDPLYDLDKLSLANFIQFLEQLRDARRSSGATQAEVAARMGTTQSAVSEIERLLGDPRVSTVRRYAAALGQVVQFDVQEGETSIAPHVARGRRLRAGSFSASSPEILVAPAQRPLYSATQNYSNQPLDQRSRFQDFVQVKEFSDASGSAA